MIAYSWEHDGLRERPTLWEALKLSAERHRGIALTGGGGKTSVMFRLADELAKMGKTVIVTTTTHIFNPPGRNVVETDCAEDAAKRLERNGSVLVVGVPAAGGKPVSYTHLTLPTIA